MQIVSRNVSCIIYAQPLNCTVVRFQLDSIISPPHFQIRNWAKNWFLQPTVRLLKSIFPYDMDFKKCLTEKQYNLTALYELKNS